MLSFLTSQRRFLITCKILFTKEHRSSPNGFAIYTWHYTAALLYCTLEKKTKVVKCMLQENDDTT